ncbi:hypothetical protein ACIA8G_06260 [Lentzea sp. NPDC051213]|uniref:hypothetical protein n=1 Tax=Lentzea sp. NPDC051213 TaxID=3364126 RepID=UPI0037ADCA46
MTTLAASAQLCVCGLSTILVLIISVLIAVAYGELLARSAVKRALPRDGRHRAPTAPGGDEP